jgi:amino acid transporter
MGEQLGLKEAVAMALGGMIGGGIYSAFGIVVAISGEVAWVAWALAGFVALCAGYSYIKLNDFIDGYGGPPTYIQQLIGNRTLAGVTGWTLLFGYIGSIALYAYAFSRFFAEMVGRLHVLSIPVANVVSVVLVLVFVGLNLLGAAETGKAEDVLTFVKVAIIGVFGLWGVFYALSGHTLTLEVGRSLSISPVMGAAMSFVAFNGWQLLMYDQGQFSDPKRQISKAILISIPVATLLYVLVALTTVSLLSISEIAVAPEVSLLYAAIDFMGPIGAFVIGLSALFSTASAVNATLFSSALFSNTLIDMGVIPDRFGSGSDDSDGDDGGIPSTIVVVIGVLSAAFAVFGSLRSITSFASLAFIATYGGMCYLAWHRRADIEGLIAPIPLVGFLGCLLFFPLLLYNLFITSKGTFYLVLLISVLVLGSELLYFKREPIEEAIPWMNAHTGGD